MVTAGEKKTIELFAFVFLIRLVFVVLDCFFKLKIKLHEIAASFVFAAPTIFILLILVIYTTAFLVLGYQSAKVLNKYKRTKTRPIFWLLLLLLFGSICSIVTAFILWWKNMKLLDEDMGETEKNSKKLRRLGIVALVITLVVLVGPPVFRNINKSPRYDLFKAQFYSNHGQDEKALINYKKALSKIPKDALGRSNLDEFFIYNEMGIQFTKTGKLDYALEAYKNALKVIKNTEGVIHYGIGTVYQNKGDFPTALDEFNEAIRLNNGLYDAYQNRAVTYRLMGEFKKSIEACKETIKLFPDIPETAKSYCSLGSAYEKLGNFEDAIDCQLEAITRAPKWRFPKERLLLCFPELRDGVARDKFLEKVRQVDSKLADYLQNKFKSSVGKTVFPK